LAGLAGGRVSLQSRNGRDLGARFPTIAPALARITVGEAVLDGEVVAECFELLQEGARSVRYVVFDLLWLDGADLRARPIEERRELLESLLANVPSPIAIAARAPGSVAQALAAARRSGHEGLIAKRRGSPYRGGRGRDWLKLKVAAGQELAIVGWEPH